MEKFRNQVLDSAGEPLPLATITVYDTGTTNPVSIFSDDGVTSESNPFTSPASGLVEFYAADGRYDILIVKTNFDDQTVVDHQLFDRNITGATGGIDNNGSTTVGADSDNNGSGDILFKIGGSTRMELKNNNDLVYNTDHMFLDFSTGFSGWGTSDPDSIGHFKGDTGLTIEPETAGVRSLITVQNNTGDNRYSFDYDGPNVQLNINHSASAENVLSINNNRNVGIRTSIFGTSAIGSLAIANGVAPITSIANQIEIFSVDSSDTKATLGLRTEQGVEAIGTFTGSHKLKIKIDGVEYWWELDAV